MGILTTYNRGTSGVATRTEALEVIQAASGYRCVLRIVSSAVVSSASPFDQGLSG